MQLHSLYVSKFTRLFYQLIYTSLMGQLGLGAWSLVSIGLADKVETWSVTVILSKKINTLDSWCVRRILNVHWSEFVTNDEIRSRTRQPVN